MKDLHFRGATPMHLRVFLVATPKQWRRQSAFWNCAHTFFAQVICSKQFFRVADGHHLPLNWQRGEDD
jgi:hypothetical protein